MSIVWGRAAYRLFKREIGKLDVFNYGEEKNRYRKKEGGRYKNSKDVCKYYRESY